MDQEFGDRTRTTKGARTDSSGNEGEGGCKTTPGDLNGLRPTTTSESKIAVLAAERGDKISVEEVVELFHANREVPPTLTVLERSATFYGPKLIVHADSRGDAHNYLITAPGPGSELLLWGAETASDNHRTGWYRLAEIHVKLSDDQPSFEVCAQCNSPMRSIEHERKALLDICDQ